MRDYDNRGSVGSSGERSGIGRQDDVSATKRRPCTRRRDTSPLARAWAALACFGNRLLAPIEERSGRGGCSLECPSSDDLRLNRLFTKKGSGASGLEFKR